MPETPKPRYSDFSCFDSMTDGELEEILRLDAQNIEGEESDTEMLLYVMEVLAYRKRNDGSIRKTPEEALKSFQENYLPCNDDEDHPEESENLKVLPRTGKGRRVFKRTIAGVAAAFAIVIFGSVTANAFGFDIWDIFIRWTQETFNFSNSVQESVPAPQVDSDLEEGALDVLLKEYGISLAVIPTWIPEGYELEDVTVDETPLRKEVLVMYRKDEVALKILINSYIEADPEQIEKSDTPYEVYEAQGVRYYMFIDDDNLKVAWTNKNCECYISGSITTEEIKAMIDSIDKG